MLISSALVLTLALGADLTPEKAAAIARDQAKAQAAVNAKYGNKKPSQLTAEEKRAIIKEQAEADQKALEKHGVSNKDWAVYNMRMGRDDLARMKAAGKDLERKEKEEAEAQKKAAEEPKEIPIQRGFSDDDPVVMEEKEGAGPRVDDSIPRSEQDELGEGSSSSSGDSSPPPTTTSKKKGGKKRR